MESAAAAAQLPQARDIEWQNLTPYLLLFQDIDLLCDTFMVTFNPWPGETAALAFTKECIDSWNEEGSPRELFATPLEGLQECWVKTAMAFR